MPTARIQQRRHPGFVHPNADAKACDARLSDLKKCGADLKSITDAHGIISQSFDRKVLTNCPETKSLLFSRSCQYRYESI